MALTFQGYSKEDIAEGLITQIEIAIQAGSPSYLVAGDFTNASISINPLSMRSDPSDSDLVYALEFTFAFNLVQSKKTAELAAMAGTASTGLYATDIQIKFTLLDGRTITLGSITAYPMRALISFTVTEGQAQQLSFSGRTIEPITSVAAKVA